MRALILILSLGVLVSCAPKGGGDSAPTSSQSLNCSTLPTLGAWRSPQTGEVLTLDSFCHGTSSLCQSQFTVAVDPQNDLYHVFVSDTVGLRGCLPIGESLCQVTLSGNQLRLFCQGSGVNFYDRD
jgi:hypothetical protein